MLVPAVISLGDAWAETQLSAMTDHVLLMRVMGWSQIAWSQSPKRLCQIDFGSYHLLSCFTEMSRAVNVFTVFCY